MSRSYKFCGMYTYNNNVYQEYLDDNEQVQLDAFEEKVWGTIKEIYKEYDPVAEAEEVSTTL